MEPQELFDFGEAIRRLKDGHAVARLGWNGKEMYIYLKTWPDTIIDGPFDPCIVMWTAQRRYQPGWLASQPDMLAEDWVQVA